MSSAGLGAGAAHAGAWTLAPGTSQGINTLAREVGDFGETWRTDTLGEYGLAKNWGGRLRLENQLRLEESYDDRLSIEAGLQRSFRFGQRGSVSVSASVLAGEALEGPECRGWGYETKVEAGRSFAVGHGSAFVNVETAFRSRGAACGRIVSGVTAGVDLSKDWWVVGKVFNEQGDGARSTKAEAMLLYDWGKYSYGLGYRREISGAFEEDGWVIAIWQKF